MITGLPYEFAGLSKLSKTIPTQGGWGSQIRVSRARVGGLK
jgi:hypothetical protein